MLRQSTSQIDPEVLFCVVIFTIRDPTNKDLPDDFDKLVIQFLVPTRGSYRPTLWYYYIERERNCP